MFKNLILLIFSLLFALLLAEGTVRLVYEEPPLRSLTGISKHSNIRFEPGLRATQTTDEFEYTIITNSNGRRDREWPSSVISDPENMLFIGDSFVMGFGVEEEFSMPGLLEQQLRVDTGRNFEVFNFGISGAVALPEYRELLFDALDIGIRARTVLVAIFIGNDFNTGPTVVRVGESKSRETPSRGRLLSNSAIYRVAVNTVKTSPQLLNIAFRLGDMFGIRVYGSPSAYIFLRNPDDDYRQHFNGLLR